MIDSFKKNWKAAAVGAAATAAISGALNMTQPDTTILTPTPSVIVTAFGDFSAISELGWVKPSTNDVQGWKKEGDRENLTYRTDAEVKQMYSANFVKLNSRVLPRLNEYLQYPDKLRWELSQSGLTGQALEDQYAVGMKDMRTDAANLIKGVEVLKNEMALRTSKQITRPQ